MKISIIQHNTVWEDKQKNLEMLEEMILPLSEKSDIIILAEMFNTGFSMKPELLSEPPDGETYKWMLSRARAGNFAICGSYMVRDHSEYFNRWVFVAPSGDKWTYDKRHLFGIAMEKDSFSAGLTRLVFSFRGIRISANICYDLRFPVWSRNRHDYDLLINSANWPQSRTGVWNTLLRARAIENQCFVAGANRVGTDGSGIRYSGESMIIDAKGDIISSADPDQETIITGSISIDELTEFRKKFPVLDDADQFTINRS